MVQKIVGELRHQPLEDCAKLDAEEVWGLRDNLPSRIPWSALVVVAGTLGPVACGCLRASSVAHCAAFHPCRFSPNRRKHKLGDDLFLGLSEAGTHPQFRREALDNTFLAINMQKLEAEDQYRVRLAVFFQSTMSHWNCDCLAARMLIPTWAAERIFYHYKDTFEEWDIGFRSRVLHAAILANDVTMARLLLHFANKADCDLSDIFLWHHTPGAYGAEMSPLLFAILVVRDRESVFQWLKLLLVAGAKFNKIDQLLTRVLLSKLMHAGEQHREVCEHVLHDFMGKMGAVLQVLNPDRPLKEIVFEFLQTSHGGADAFSEGEEESEGDDDATAGSGEELEGEREE